MTVIAARADLDFTPIRSFLAEAAGDGVVAGGAVMVLRGGEVVFETGFGFADLEKRIPYRVETPGVIASISKPLLGTAIYRLVEAGKLEVGTPISAYLPEFKDRKLESGAVVKRAPTVTELLTHTSGLRHDEAAGGHPWFASWTKGQPLSAVVGRYAAEFPFKAQPGTRYAYSGIGTDVAARVAEVASGKPRNELLVAEVCGPLGMERTSYRDATRVKAGDALAVRYHRGEDGGLCPSRKRAIPPSNAYSASGGSIVSSAPDLARWLLALRNGGVHDGTAYLSPGTVETMLGASKLGRNARGGLFVRRKDAEGRPVVLGHSGSSGTNCWIDFEHDTIGIMLTQTRGEDIKPFRIGLERRITRVVAVR